MNKELDEKLRIIVNALIKGYNYQIEKRGTEYVNTVRKDPIEQIKSAVIYEILKCELMKEEEIPPIDTETEMIEGQILWVDETARVRNKFRKELKEYLEGLMK